MKRVPVSLQSFLRDVLSASPLRPDERALLEDAERAESADLAVSRTRELLQRLLDRGVFEVLEREREGEEELLTLRDPERRVRASFRLPLKTSEPILQHIRLPLDPTIERELKPHQVQELLALQGSLISYDRVLSPRELVQRLPPLLASLLPGATAEFHPLEMRSADEWPEVNWDALPAPRAELERLSRHRDYLLSAPALPDGGSMLILPMGDDPTGWRGLLVVSQRLSHAFDSSSVTLAVLAAQHWKMLLSTALRLQGLIFYDFLTGIYNRSYFEEQLERETSLARRREQQMALLIVDIDDFKAFNTKFGYAGGDRVLATVALVLKGALRGTDTLARYGGEEFAIILAPPVPIDEARRIGERLRAAVAEESFPVKTLDGGSQTERVTVSIGGALLPDSGRGPRELWNAANRCLLEAKARGKNQIRFPESS